MKTSTEELQIIPADTPVLIAETRTLFSEYAAGLGVDLCFQNFIQELASLPGEYAAPSGALLIAKWQDAPAGCVALRKIDDQTCEMKRLYVPLAFRGKKIGYTLARSIIAVARRLTINTSAWTLCRP